MTTPVEQTTGAEDVVWDLSDLIPNFEHATITNAMEALHDQASQFAERYRGKVATLSAEQMAAALTESEALNDQGARLGYAAYLRWTTNANNAEYGALLQRAEEFGSQISQITLFFDLEWADSPEDQARIATSPALKRWRHHLHKLRQERPHQLSEPEEKILAEKSVTGSGAWTRYFSQLLSSQSYDLDGKQVPQETVLKQLYSPDREARKRGGEALTAGLDKNLLHTTYIFNTILAEKASNDRLRKFPTWISSRNLANEASDESVEALVKAVTSRYDIVARYYKIKRQLLGYDELFEYDRYAPLSQTDTKYSWNEAKSMVLNAFTSFHPTIGGTAAEFFDKNWIHAPVVAGKRGGAFAAPTAPSVHPYVFVNYSGRARDVMTLAHELGHGIHMSLSRPHGVFGAGTPLTTAETASVFGEMMVFSDLMAKETDRNGKIALLAGKIEDTFATVFRQIAMNRFEDAIHTARRTQGELSTAQLSAFWLETQRAMFGDSVTLRDEYKSWWSYIPHFIGTPGYVYAYAFGELLVMALLAEYRKQGPSFAPKYIELLSAGGSDTPENILKLAGVNLKDDNFWNQGLNMIEDLVKQLEDLVAGKV